MGERKTTYQPLVEILDNDNPTTEQINDAFKRASRKNKLLEVKEFGGKFDKLVNGKILSKDQVKKVYDALEKCAISLRDRNKKDTAQTYTNLATYLYHHSV